MPDKRTVQWQCWIWAIINFRAHSRGHYQAVPTWSFWVSVTIWLRIHFLSWLGTLTSLRVLNLRLNRLHGSIEDTKTSSEFQSLQIVGLSWITSCTFNKWKGGHWCPGWDRVESCGAGLRGWVCQCSGHRAQDNHIETGLVLKSFWIRGTKKVEVEESMAIFPVSASLRS